MNFQVVSHLITPSKIYSPHGGPSLTVSQFPSLSVYHNQSQSRSWSQCTETQQMASANEGHKQSSAKRVAVVGAGVSGLAAAYKLKLHGLNVTIFEAEGRAGGKLRSISQDGLIWDEGANTMTESEMEVGYLLDNLELRGKQQFPISQNKRYIARNGEPVLIPSNPIALIRSNFLSTQSKFQIMLEPFLWKKSNFAKMSDAEESVGGFFQRHFGKEVVDYLIDPFVAGTCAGDPESLSMPHAFPELWNLEKEFGSIIFGAIRSKFSAKREKSGALNSSSTNKKHQRGSFSFLGGMQTLTDALCKDLGKDELKLQSRVLELSYNCKENSVSESWSVSYAPIHDKQSEEQSFDAVVMTLCKCFTWLSYKGNSIAMTWVLQMLHLPCYFGQPQRHLLTTGWSAFINKKKLVSGDVVLFLRGGDGELRLGIRRAAQVKTDSTFPALSSQKLNVGTISAVYQLSKCTTCTICLFFFFFWVTKGKIVISTGMKKFLQSNSFDIVLSMIITSMVCWQVEICSSCRRQGKLHSHLGNEVFREFLPPLLVNNAVLPWFDPAVLGGFLCLPAFTDVWVMKEYGKKESWTKFSFCKREDISTRIDLVCLLEDGEFLLSRDEEQLVVYNSKDETSRDMVVCGIPGSFTSGGTYVESLISPERIYGIGRQCEACERMKRILQVMVETYEAGTCQSSTNKESYRVEPSSSSSNIEASISRLTMLK